MTKDIEAQSGILTSSLWPKLTAMYGHKFTSQFGESPEETWIKCLVGVTGRQMADGLNECLDRYPEWPPGAAQFRSLCLGIILDEKGRDISKLHAGRAYISINDPKHPCNDPSSNEYNPSRNLGIESDENKAKRKVAGKAALGDLMKQLK